MTTTEKPGAATIADSKPDKSRYSAPEYKQWLSLDEIIANELPYLTEPRKSQCLYCENVLMPQGLVAEGKVWQWRESPCDCPKAVEARQKAQTERLRYLQKRWGEEQASIAEKQAEERKVKYTLSELTAANYPLDPATTPAPLVCEFCGATVDPVAMVFWGLTIWGPPYCECERGKAKYEARVAEEERIAAEENARKRQAKLDEKVRGCLRDCGIKNRFMSRTFENFARNTPQRANAYDNAKYYADNFSEVYSKDGTGLYIEGTFGTGKTHLAVAIALRLIRQGVNVICKTSIELLKDIKAAFRYENGEEEETARYKRCALLVIDDLGKEQCTDWSLPKLYEIVNDRYEKCKPTIVTTNYSHDELIRRLVPKGGDNITAGALVSRLKEAAIPMTMAWHDWRENGK